MIRIKIDWNYTSPILGIAVGIVSIDNIKDSWASVENILKFKVRVERGSIGFTGIKEGEGISTKLFDLFHDKVSLMAHSYHRGMLLEDYDFEWYEAGEKINWRTTKKEFDQKTMKIIQTSKSNKIKEGA